MTTDRVSDECPQGRTDYEECFAPFRYCPVKGCGRTEGGVQLPLPGDEPLPVAKPTVDLAAISERCLDLTVRAHLDAMHAAGVSVPYDEISDRTKRIVRNQLRDTVERAVAVVYDVMNASAVSS